MRNFLKGLINVKRILIITIISSIIVTGLASFTFVIKLLDSTNANFGGIGLFKREIGDSKYDYNVPAQVENMFTSLVTSSNIVYKDNGSYKLNIDLDKSVDEMYTNFIKSTKGQDALKYLRGTDEEKKEYLKNMVRAELITQYPDLRSNLNGQMGAPVDSNEVQGCITIKRTVSEPIYKVTGIEKSTNTSLELKGIVCWGDQLTAGKNENENYPYELQQLLQKNVYNVGFEGETAEQILLRAGASGYRFVISDEKTVIGGSVGTTVSLDAKIIANDVITNQVFNNCDGSSNEKTIKCVIGNVEGELIYRNNQYVFTRTVDGDEETVEKNTEIVIESQSGGYNTCFPIIWLGNSNENYVQANKISELTSMYRTLIEAIGLPDDYIIIIPMTYKSNNGEIQNYSDTDYNKLKTAFNKLFSDRCIDLKASGCSDINDYKKISEIIKNKINFLGFEIESSEEKNLKAGRVTYSSSKEIKIGQEIILEYIPLGNSLQPQPGTLRWLIKQDDDYSKNAALQFFSIDENGNIVVANWNRVTTTVTSNEQESFDSCESDSGFKLLQNSDSERKYQKIDYVLNTSRVNYENLISRYTMPFDYLWILLVMGDDTQFVDNLTKLTLDSQITISLFDELTQVETNIYERHRDEHWTRTITKVIDHYDDGSEVEHDEEYDDDYTGEDKYCYTNILVETNKVKCQLTYADVWNLKYNLNVNPAQYYEEPIESTITDIPDEEWTLTSSEGPKKIADGNINSDVLSSYWDKDLQKEVEYYPKIGEWRKYETIEEYDKTVKWQTGEPRVLTTIQTRGYKYSEGVPTTIEKTDKTATKQEIETGQFNEPNFVKYYLYSENARYNISSIYDWLFIAIENSDGKTSGMEEITKYLIYKATENDLGVVNYDFNMYNTTDFIDLLDDVGDADTNTDIGIGDFAGGDLVEIARRCHEYIRNNNFYYSSQINKSQNKYVRDGISTGNGTIPYPNGTSYTDCSAYITWVLYEYGYTEFAGHQKTSAWFGSNPYTQYGWKTVPASQAQPGDILWTKDHVEIYAGNGTYAAGSTDAIRRDMSYKNMSLPKIISKGGFTKAIRVTKPN